MRCPVCDETFPYRPNNWGGHHIPRYKITVCNICYAANWDGWSDHFEPWLLNHLKAAGISPPPRNKAGRLPRD